MAWTDEMVEKLTSMWLGGATTNEIAKELGLSKNSVVGKVHRLNLSARPSPIKKKEEKKVTKKTQTILKKDIEPKEKNVSTSAVQKTSEKQNSSESKKCLRLNELDNHSCRWPIGDPKDENFCFCGKKVRTGQTYCDEHAAIAYVKPFKKEK